MCDCCRTVAATKQRAWELEGRCDTAAAELKQLNLWGFYGPAQLVVADRDSLKLSSLLDFGHPEHAPRSSVGAQACTCTGGAPARPPGSARNDPPPAEQDMQM